MPGRRFHHPICCRPYLRSLRYTRKNTLHMQIVPDVTYFASGWSMLMIARSLMLSDTAGDVRNSFSLSFIFHTTIVANSCRATEETFIYTKIYLTGPRDLSAPATASIFDFIWLQSTGCHNNNIACGDKVLDILRPCVSCIVTILYSTAYLT